MGSCLSRNDFPVAGRTVLITGGSRGLGLAAARQLSSKGAHVVIVARDPTVLAEALTQVEASAQSPSQRFFSLTADTTKASECSRVIAEVTAWNDDNPPDIVWCCSGSAHPTLFVDTPVEQLQTMMDSNYFSSAYMAHATLNAWLRPAIDGVTKKSTEAKTPTARHIIFTGSFVSLYSFAGFTPYSPSKAAIRSLSDSLSQEMNLYAGAHPNEPRVRIHTVFPATMPTKSLDDENKVKTDVTKALEEGDQILTPDECARRAIAGLERGEELIATSTIIRLVMTTVMGGAIRGGFWTGLVNTLLSWVVMIVMVFIRWDMDVKVRNWGKKHGASGMASKDKKPTSQFSLFSVETIVSIWNCGAQLTSIAGIASAGTQLSNTLFKLYKTVRNAPKEIQSVAIEMSGLTATLEHLRDIIRGGHSYAKPQFWLNNSSDLFSHLTAPEKVENRFKAQAESLILAGQASFQNEDDPEPIPDPPQERAPSPPVCTSKRLPSPVRESEIPGHVRTEELYGQNKNSEDNAFLSGTATFGPDFHRRGDAATFLYNLVFLNEISVHGAPYEDPYITETRNGEKIEVRHRHRHSDDSDDSEHDGASRRERVRFQDSKSQEPERLVNRLLLAWTSLSESEIEKGKADTQPDIRRAFGESESSDSEESLYGPEDEEKAWRKFRRRQTRLGRDTFQREGIKYNNTPEFDPCGRRILRPTRSETPSSVYIYELPRQNGPSPASEEPEWRLWPTFHKPDFVVLPQADSADSENGPITPKVDLASVNLGTMRQGDEPIWDCDAFMSEKIYPGKAIMGALIGDTSARNPHGLDLAHTLIRGRSMKLVYIRGNEKEADERAMKEEYVAIGEEWASFEALQQLGLVVKRREEDRVLLDPIITWLRSMRQRRNFTPTFYNSISTFRQKHGYEAPSLVGMTDSEARTTFVLDRRAKAEDEVEVDILNLPIDEEPQKTPEATTEAQSKTKTSTLQPQQTSHAEFDTSEVASHVSSGSRLSSPKSSGHGSESTEWQDDDKRPLAPTDSGVGSSIVSGR
ncbi:uncharacterized protein BKA55DRAFT_593457 [Fusarium redolens]|uniref:3-dehydrosphinganine reductase n=1 Tax=Fusarium redolens TaxID=48865 RepID=A0A9P9HB10_FUSRE|nr:uncharacterized protein BKA55DRAFT_593457 [Fusarium redolens]KAH7253802.1 hypothetical protein BKA55DRAFT_593457 [Fusarium redolens]